MVGHFPVRDLVVGGDSFGRLKRAAAGEDGEAPQHDPLGRAQQPVAPVQERPQCLVLRQHVAPAARQLQELSVEPCRRRLDSQERRPRRRQLQRQRHAFEPAAHGDYCADAVVVDREARLDRARPLSEQLHRGGRQRLARRYLCRRTGLGQGQGLQPLDLLACDAQRLL